MTAVAIYYQAKAMAEYLTRARVTGPSTQYRTENLDPNARVFEWLDRLIFGSSQNQKEPYHGSHSHDYHHSGDDHGYYDDYSDDDCHHHHHDYDDYHNRDRFQASNSQHGQSVSAAPQIQIYPLSVDGFMRPLANHHSSIPGVSTPTVGVGFPFSNTRGKEEKRSAEAVHNHLHDGNGLAS